MIAHVDAGRSALPWADLYGAADALNALFYEEADSITVRQRFRSPADCHKAMEIVGAIEIVAAFLVLFKPKIGGLIVTLWLWGIVANLLLIPGYYDIALRDFGLSLGALALSRLAAHYERHVAKT